MSTRQTPSSHLDGHDEQALFDFGDAIVTGEHRAPANDLEATAIRVQRALQMSADPSPRSMPTDLKQQIWEDLMASATTHPERSQGNPWAPPSQAAPDGRVAERPSHIPLRRMAWSHAATAALVLVLVLAGMGVWRISGGDFSSGGGGDDPATHPGFAAQPSTPETIEAPVVSPSPVAAHEPITACDLSDDIPIIPDLAEDQSPVSTTSLYVVRHDPGFDYRGDLKIGCEGEESVTLAENVISAWRGPWEGTVSIAILPPGEDDLANQQNGYVNIATGEIVTFGKPADDTEPQSVMTYALDGSPWVVGPLADDPSELAIVDLRTMESRPLSAVTGIPTPDHRTVMLSTPAEDGTVALGYAQTKYGGRLQTNTDAPGDLLLLGASFEDSRWIVLGDDLPLILQVTLSPDGDHAAVIFGSEGDSYAYGVISTRDGSFVGRSNDIPRMDNPFVTWIQDGGAIAYLAGNELQTIAVDGNGEPETAFTADQQLMQLQTTWNPNVVVAITREDHGSDADPESTDVDKVFSINVESGEAHEFTGMDASASIGWITNAGALMMYQWDDTYPDTVTYQVFDPVSGNQIGEIVDAPSVQPKARTLPTIGPRSIAVSDDGRVEVIALGTQHIYAFTTGSTGMTMQRVASPQGLLAELFLTANLSLSPDGTMLSLTGEEDEGRTRYLIALDDPDAEWLAVPNTVVGERGRGHIEFAQGIGG